MQNSERQKFEESWKNAFEGAETLPPDRVWNSIELNLAGQESAAMKKKVVFYQRLAAATILFALLVGSYAGYEVTRGRGEEVTKGRGDEVMKGRGDEVMKGRGDEVMKGRGDEVTKQTVNEKPSAPAEKTEIKTKIKETPKSISRETFVARNDDKKHDATVQQQELREQLVLAEDKPEENIIAAKEPDEKAEVQKADIPKEEEKKVTEVVSPLLQQLEAGPETVVEPKRTRKTRESLWLALGGSAGNYTPNTPTATSPTIMQSSFAAKGPALSLTTVPAPKPQSKVGSSYSVGVGVGKKFGRFIVQTGVNLNKQQINYTSNYDSHTSSNSSKAAMSDYLPQSNNLSLTSEYTVSSTMDIVSIPVQLGYMIIDRKLGWHINGGMSNDFFIRNILVDKSGQRDRSIEESGSASPYRSVNWSALASTELSYRIGAHYRVSLVPGARYSFHSILKNTTDSGRPVVLDVGFRFRYIFD